MCNDLVHLSCKLTGGERAVNFAKGLSKTPRLGGRTDWGSVAFSKCDTPQSAAAGAAAAAVGLGSAFNQQPLRLHPRLTFAPHVHLRASFHMDGVNVILQYVPVAYLASLQLSPDI